LNKYIKITLLFGIIFLNYLLINTIPVHKIDWNDFFPQTKTIESSQNWFEANTQYLFIELPDTQIADKFLEDGEILNYFTLDPVSNLHLLIFNFSQQSNLLEKIKSYSCSGTSIIGQEIMDNFMQEIEVYLLYIVPILLVILFFLTSMRYWINIIFELNLFYLFLLSSIYLLNFTMTPSSLLALSFLIIYAFTLFNYLFSGEINRRKLSFGIAISILTTALSAFFLYLSKFGLIHSFGKMLLFGLLLLFVYTMVRIFFTKHSYLPITWFEKLSEEQPMVFRISLPIIIAVTILISLNYKNFLIDLNPLNLIEKSSPSIQKINSFEVKHLPSLPFVIEISLRNGDFTELENAKSLNALLESLDTNLTVKTLIDLNTSYRIFSQKSFSTATDESYAQFLLALEMSSDSIPLFSYDYKQSFITMLLPINSSSDAISKLLKQLNTLEKQDQQFSINVLGKIADMERFSYLFFKEFIISLSLSIGFVFIFFLFYCRSYKAFVIVFSTLFSVISLLGFHALFNLNMTLMTLLSVVLFSGLIADSLIHIFICYNDNNDECFTSVTKPIIFSNVSMIIGLAGMFFSGSLMKEFGMELSILLVANLIFILYILPPIFELEFFKKRNVQGGSFEIKRN